MKDIVEEWARLWEIKYAQRPFIHWAKEMTLTKELTKQLDKQKIMSCLERYFNDDSAFTARAKHSFGFFYSQINRYLEDTPESGRY